MATMITLTNDYHNTTARVRPTVDDRGRMILTAYQVARARRMLCGVRDCSCGGTAGVRGGEYRVEPVTNPWEPGAMYEVVRNA